MVPDGPGILLALLLSLVPLAVGALLLYGVVRLAVRHGVLDARRRWRDETGGGRPPSRDEPGA